METLLQRDRLNLGASDRPCRLSTPNLADLEQIRSELAREALDQPHRSDLIASELAPTENCGHKKGRCKAAAEGRR